jgi:hypothetical protein
MKIRITAARRLANRPGCAIRQAIFDKRFEPLGTVECDNLTDAINSSAVGHELWVDPEVFSGLPEPYTHYLQLMTSECLYAVAIAPKRRGVLEESKRLPNKPCERIWSRSIDQPDLRPVL